MTLSYNEINAVTQDYTLPGWTDLLFEDTVALWWLLKRRPFVDGLITGRDLEVTDKCLYMRKSIEYGQANSQDYDVDTVITQSRTDIFNAIRVPVRGAVVSQAINLTDKLGAEGSKAALIDLVEGKLANLRKTMTKKLETRLFTTTANTGASGYHGLGDLFTAATFQGIASADVGDKWPANLISGAKSANWATMAELRRTAKRGNSAAKKPGLYLMPDSIYDTLEGILMPQINYNMQMGKDDVVAQAGFSGLKWGQAYVIADSYYSDNLTTYIDGLNMNQLRFKFVKGYAFTNPVWEHKQETPDTEVANIRAIGNLWCDDRGSHVRASLVS